MPGAIPLDNKLTNVGQFLTAPVSILQGRKVELLDTCKSTAQKIALIALSTLCLVLTLGISHLVGLQFKKVKQLVPKLEEKAVLPEAGPKKAHQTLAPVGLDFNPDQHTAVASAVVPILDPSRIQPDALVALEPSIHLHSVETSTIADSSVQTAMPLRAAGSLSQLEPCLLAPDAAPAIEIATAQVISMPQLDRATPAALGHEMSSEAIIEEWIKIIISLKSAPKSLDEVKAVLSSKGIEYRIGDLQKLLMQCLKEGASVAVELILSLEKKFPIDDMFEEMLACFKPVNIESETEKAIKQGCISKCFEVLFDQLEFTEKQIQELFVKACCCSAHLNFINKMVEVKTPLFFKDVISRALIENLTKPSESLAINGSVQMRLFSLSSVTNPAFVRAFNPSGDAAGDEKVKDLFRSGILSTGSTRY